VRAHRRTRLLDGTRPDAQTSTVIRLSTKVKRVDQLAMRSVFCHYSLCYCARSAASVSTNAVSRSDCAPYVAADRSRRLCQPSQPVSSELLDCRGGASGVHEAPDGRCVAVASVRQSRACMTRVANEDGCESLAGGDVGLCNKREAARVSTGSRRGCAPARSLARRAGALVHCTLQHGLQRCRAECLVM